MFYRLLRLFLPLFFTMNATIVVLGKVDSKESKPLIHAKSNTTWVWGTCWIECWHYFDTCWCKKSFINLTDDLVLWYFWLLISALSRIRLDFGQNVLTQTNISHCFWPDESTVVGKEKREWKQTTLNKNINTTCKELVHVSWAAIKDPRNVPYSQKANFSIHFGHKFV